jgi:hypothetical protein
VLPSSGHLQSHPYAKAPTFTMGYIWIISRGVDSCIQSVSPFFVSVRGSNFIISPKKTKGANGWRALTITHGRIIFLEIGAYIGTMSHPVLTVVYSPKWICRLLHSSVCLRLRQMQLSFRANTSTFSQPGRLQLSTTPRTETRIFLEFLCHKFPSIHCAICTAYFLFKWLMYYFLTKANVKCPKDFTRHISMFVSTL